MSKDMSRSESGTHALCPEIRLSGGLANTLKGRAADLGLTLAGLVDVLGGAELTTARGRVAVRLGVERRVFVLDIHEARIEWAAGATESLDEACRAVAAWRDGMSFGEFLSNFSFMVPGDLAFGLAEGKVAEAQWQNLLRSEFPSSCSALLAELSAFADLRGFFPEISYGDIRFTLPPPRQDARMLWIRGVADGYRLRESGLEEREHVLRDVDEVVRHIIEFFASP
jgi:hypothetical protein